MHKDIINKFKLKQIEYIIQSTEYQTLLAELVKSITTASLSANNEANIVSIFELELFSNIKELFGLKYYPEKELRINTERHISKGRIDSKIGAVVIEFKHKSKLVSLIDKKKASNQLSEYLLGLYNQNGNNYTGFVLDGVQCKIITINEGLLNEGAFEKLSTKHIDLIIRNIVLLEKIALTPENLVRDFCNDDNISSQLTICLYKTLKFNASNRSKMLFDEWKELFKLAHDDNSKQAAIIERRKSLSNVVGEELSNNNDEYMALYAVQTTYAIILKIIAYKVISKIRFNKSLIDFNKLSSADSETLRLQMCSLEEGAIFRSLGIGNLLEGDFFAWYCDINQWGNSIADFVKEIFCILTQYEDKAVFQTGEKAKDLFRDLFMKIIPDKVRHSLGEYYTPSWLADNLVMESILLTNKKKNWTALDPCAGSGTFVTILIKYILKDTASLSKKEQLQAVLSRVKAIDLNPLAVLTARINYFINISHLISNDDEFEIPVYLGDASYVPSNIDIDGVSCLQYNIKTIRGDIEITLPCSTCQNNLLFSATMTSVEQDILNLDVEGIETKLQAITNINDLTPKVKNNIKVLAEKFVDLERRKWNGIWARIVTNFLTTANLGKFDLIVGNPPWIDWKNLPAGYRDRIKSICINRHLFSGDGVTGGINLNICALISNVSAENWLATDGILAFLMPDTILYQKTYDGFRQLFVNNGSNLYFQQIFDWNKAGHPFSPVTQKFATYFISHKKVDYNNGILLKRFVKQRSYKLPTMSSTHDFNSIKDNFTQINELIGQVNVNSTTFTCAENAKELESFKHVSGSTNYKGREGIEFYPQELFILEVDDEMPSSNGCVIVKNYQNKKSKYKIPQELFPLETHYLHPLIKGVNISRFHLDVSNFVVPFPYETGMRSPISAIELSKKSACLARYFNKYKSVFNEQTSYNDKIIGNKHNTEFYALARVGDYSYSPHYVAFRDNSKWGACVVNEVITPWGESKRPQFQNHAVTISQNKKGENISLDEAHYICAILNARIVESYILKSSDSRSFKIDPPINIPQYNMSNKTHKQLSNLSKIAHEHYNNDDKMKEIDECIDKLVIQL